MQLLIILALLLYGGKGNAEQLIEEVKPVLEYVGGDEMKQALKSAEEITSVLSAVKQFTAETSPAPDNTYSEEKSEAVVTESFPLAPINDVADKKILNSLTAYMQAN